MKSVKSFFILTVLLVPSVVLLYPNVLQAEGMTETAFLLESYEPAQITVQSQYGSNGETIGVIVDPALWMFSSVQTAINQYISDLNITGYEVLFEVNTAPSAELLKANLTNWYNTYDLSGVTLIGNLPYARFYHPATGGFSAETFICDLFLMDLDGNWTDSEPDGVYDIHNSGSGDIYPEIYVGRIDASSRTLGGLTNDANIVNLLNRIHNYRIGLNSLTHQAITYIDDDWEGFANGTYDDWPGWLDNAYSTRNDYHSPPTTTTAADWLTKMTQSYEWAHICVHSGASPGTHYFGPGGLGEGTVTSTQIHSTGPAMNFYNLFCCHGADFITTDCLATTYLFSGANSVGVIGSTKSGGMLGGSTFYDSLADDSTLGQAFSDWLQTMTVISGSYVEWFYGMVILGDPFLTIDYDVTAYEPVVSSSTHPSQEAWYSSASPQLTWVPPFDLNGIVGYYYVFDQNPATTPTIASTYTTSTSLSPSISSDGTYYFHLVAIDGHGNIGEPAHYQLNIDASVPTVAISSPSNNARVNPGTTFNLIWTASDDGSGYSYAEIRVNDALEATVDAPATSYELTLEAGTYSIEVKAFDESGQSATSTITLNVQTFFQSTTFYIILGAGGGSLALIVTAVIVIVVVKRKKV